MDTIKTIEKMVAALEPVAIFGRAGSRDVEVVAAKDAIAAGRELIEELKGQEPIGEMFFERLDARNSYPTQIRPHFFKEIPPAGTKLYQHPPQQRKPLTDEQLKNHYQNNEWLDGVRFAEQFHGIKENT